MDYKFNVPVIELMLPETGQTVVLYKYLTIGQSRELQRIILGDTKFNVETKAMDSMSAKTLLDMQDLAASMVIKEVRLSDGTVLPFSSEWLSGLPNTDGSLVYEKVNEITNASQMATEDKKK